MRGQANGIIMLRGAKPQRARADFLQDFDEGGNAGIVRVAGFISRRRSTGLNTRHHGFGRFCDQGVSMFAEEIGVGMRDSRQFPAGHGMAAEEERTFSSGKSSSAAWA